MSFTSTCPVDQHGRPVDPYTFGLNIQHSQPRELAMKGGRHGVLFNKGRYFETTVYDPELRNKVVNLSGAKVEFGNMVVDKWDKLEDFVIAMNIEGYYVKIDIDWI
jgi:hypothetical protein